MAARTEWTGTASDLLDTLEEMEGRAGRQVQNVAGQPGWHRPRQQQTVDASAAYRLHAPEAWWTAQAERYAYEQAVVAAWRKRPFLTDAKTGANNE
jgi:hypothetical protein